MGFNNQAKVMSPNFKNLGSSVELERRTRFEKLLDIFATGQFALAGATEEVATRLRGEPGRGFGRAIQRGVQERQSFSTITGHPITGFALDVVVDPVNILPFGAIPNIAKGGAKITGLAKLANVAGKAIEASPKARRVKIAVGEALVKNSLLKRLNDAFLTDRKAQAIQEIDGISRAHADSVRRQIEQLVPTENRRQVLFDIVESQPLALDPTDPAAQKSLREFTTRFAALDNDEKIAFRRVNKVLGDLEDLKIRAGLLTRKHAAGFLRKHGVAYVPRLLARKDTMVSQGEGLLQAIEEGEPLVRGQYDPVALRELVDKMKATREVVDRNTLDQLDAFYKGKIPGLTPSFTFTRKTTGTVAGQQLKNIETDIAKVLGFSTAETVRAVSARMYIGDMARYLQENGLLIEAGTKGLDEASLFDALVSSRKAKGGRDVVSEIEGLERVASPNELENLLSDLKSKFTEFNLNPKLQIQGEKNFIKKALPNFRKIRISGSPQSLFTNKVDELLRHPSPSFVVGGQAILDPELGFAQNIFRLEDVLMKSKGGVRGTIPQAITIKLLDLPKAATTNTADVTKNLQIAKQLSREPFERVTGTGIAAIDGKFAPRAIVQELKNALRLYQDPEPVFKFWTDMQRWWKAWQLFPFASYHSRNGISNIFLSHIDGVHSVSDAKQMHFLMWKYMRRGEMDNTVKILGEGVPLTERGLVSLMQKTRVIRSGQTREIFGAIDRATDPSSLFHKWLNPFTTKNQVLRGGAKVAEFLEDSSRATHFYNRLKVHPLIKGKKSVSTADLRKAANETAERVHKHLFDYEHGLTNFERRYFRDLAFPFWTFTRFNIPLQLEALVMQPRKFVPFAKSKDFVEDQFGGPQPDEELLADWLKNSLRVRWRYNASSDNHEYFIMDGWWPGSDIGKSLSFKRAWKEVKNMLAPAKVVIELMENYSMYRDKSIFEFTGQQKRLLGVPMDARFEHFFRTFRPLNDADRVLVDVDRGEWGSAIARPLIGRSYPIGFERQKQRYLWELNLRLSTAKKLRTREAGRLQEPRTRAGFSFRGFENNVERLDKTIAELEETKKRYE